MDKETSAKVSSLAADILNTPPAFGAESISHGIYNALLADAKILAGSALFQDEAGQVPLNKKTSSRVSTIASKYLNYSTGDLRDDAGQPEEHVQKVCDEIQTIAGSALSQDETPDNRNAS